MTPATAIAVETSAAVLRILIVDLSSLAWRYLLGKPGAEPGEATKATLAAISRLADGFDRVVIACDPPRGRRSFRVKIEPGYKAGRAERPAHLWDELEGMIEHLGRSGYHVLRAPAELGDDGKPTGYHYEADDTIATSAAWCAKRGFIVVIASEDKDLMQCMDDKVSIVKPSTGERITPATMAAGDRDFLRGLTPRHMVDLLALGGDKSDNYKPYPDVGNVTAAELLRDYGTACGAVEAILETPPGERHPKYKAPIVESIRKHGPDAVMKGLDLAAARTEVPLDLESILTPRPVQHEPARAWDSGSYDDTAPDSEEPPRRSRAEQLREHQATPAAPAPPPSGPRVADPAPVPTAPASAPRVEHAEPRPAQRSTALALPPPVAIVDPRDPAWNSALQPNTGRDAYRMAEHIFAGKLYEKKFASVDAIWTVILIGREHGLSAMTALQSMTIIEGKVEMDAGLIVAKVQTSPLCEHFELIESTDTHATYETKRRGERKEMRMTFTVEEAERRGLFVVNNGKRVTKWGKETNWHKMPDVMCMWRCATKLARAKYPDVVRGLYGQGEIREARAADGIIDADFEAA